MNIILPLAGIKNIDESNYSYPLPLIEVNGFPLIQYVTENLLSIKGNNNFIFIVREEDCSKYHLDKTLKLLVPNSKVCILKSKTNGAVSSILMAIDLVTNKEEEVIIANPDQFFVTDINESLFKFRNEKASGGLITFKSVHPRWSFVLTDKKNNVLQAAEKNPISRNAIAGFYYFDSFNTFVKCAFKAIEIEDYHNGSFFTSALINQLILLNKKIVNFEINGEDYKSFYSTQKIKEFEFYLNEKK